MKGKSNKMFILAGVVAIVVIAGILVSYQSLLSSMGIQSGTPGPGISGITEPITDEEVIEEVITDGSSTEGESIGISEDVTVEVTSVTVTVEMSSAGFDPDALLIRPGDSVVFVTTDSGSYWPASVKHPTHTVYPGSAFSKCGSGEVIFDACEGLGESETFEFTFNEVGEWAFHDHWNPSNTGFIVVEQF